MRIPQYIASDLIDTYVGVYLVKDGTTVTADTIGDKEIQAAQFMAISKMKRYVGIAKRVEIVIQPVVDLPDDFDGVLEIIPMDQGDIMEIPDDDDVDYDFTDTIENHYDFNYATKAYYDSLIDYDVDRVERKLLIRNYSTISGSRALLVYDILDKFVKPEYYDPIARDFFKEFFFAYLDQITGAPLKKYKVADGEERFMNAKEAIETLGELARAAFPRLF